MLFNSYIFVLFFLPVCLLGYFGFNQFGKYQTAQIFLLSMSLYFYGYFNPQYLPIIIASILFNYSIYLLMDRPHVYIGSCRRKLLLLCALIFNLGMLGYFKYTNFFIDTINHAFHTNWNLLHIVLPLGISFFTFQQISFIIDTYRGGVPAYSFLNYACYVTYFPQLIAGPIVSHDELIPQFMDVNKKKINWDNLASGIYLFSLGLAKKVLLADTFGNAANIGFNNIEALNTTNALISMLAYTIQIYFDFSGYCDMASGIGRMMNIDLPLNFNSPYKSLTINEFWDRWHITLTRFFTKYVYIPLGGNRKGPIRTYINILIVFLLSGFWHGAGFNFILWGGCHGVFCIISRHFKSFMEKIPAALNWLITFLFVNAAWVLFRAPSLTSAILFFKKIFLFDFGAIDEEVNECFRLPELTVVLNYTSRIENHFPHFLMIVIFTVTFILLLKFRNAQERLSDYRPTTPRLCTTALLMVWCIFSFANISTFLYFNF